MKIDFKKIINIKNKQDLKTFPLDKPIFQSNYLFHYLIMLSNLTALKLEKFPIYIENNDGLNGFHIAAKEYNFDIISHLIKEYPEYIYNRNLNRETFANYLPFEEIITLIKAHPNLDWNDLIQRDLINKILVNLDNRDLIEFLKLFPLNLKTNNQFLFNILHNDNLKSNDKIKILDQFTDKEINIKAENGGGLIFVPIVQADMVIFDYLLNRNIDVDYYTFISTESPLKSAIYHDINNNQFIYTKKILDVLKAKPDMCKNICKKYDKFLDNIAHSLLYIRYAQSEMMDLTDLKSPNYSLDYEILKLCTDDVWNQPNIEKMSPLELLIHHNFEIYSKIIIDNKIAIDPELILNTEQELKDNVHEAIMLPGIKQWLNLYKKQPKYVMPQNDIIIEDNKYSHSTLFQAKFKDVAIFNLYLKDTYKNLLIPNMNSHTIENLTFDDTFKFSDNLIAKNQAFPWIISYHSESEYFIHPYLNNLINAERHDNNKRFSAVFVSLIYEHGLHANILIYDYKNMTIERFEPYGNTVLIENTIDDILEEELTWSTGLKYLRPNDYLPMAGFQTLSDEKNPITQKAGDFGGFCLAWCLWYLETKLKNPDIESKILVEKLISKLNKSDLKFIEYIRNYSNKINKKRIEYMKEIGIDSKEISNIHLSNNNDDKITNYLVNKSKM